jgi:hypothetical protein
MLATIQLGDTTAPALSGEQKDRLLRQARRVRRGAELQAL